VYTPSLYPVFAGVGVGSTDAGVGFGVGVFTGVVRVIGATGVRGADVDVVGAGETVSDSGTVAPVERENTYKAERPINVIATKSFFYMRKVFL